MRFEIEEDFEEEIIKVICEKVVKLREAPFTRAVEQLQASHQ